MYSEPWLPDCALRSPYAAQALASVVNGWLADWLPSHNWRGGEALAPVTDRDGWARLRGDDGFAIAGRPRAMMDLAYAVLGRKSGSPTTDRTTDRDARLLRRMAATALDDFMQRIDKILPSAGYEAASARQWELTIGPAGAPVIAVQLPQSAVAAFARRAFPATAAIAPMSDPRGVAQNAPLTARASLGTAALAVDQIMGIEVDDIILLDTAPGDPIALEVEGVPLGRRFHFAQSDGLISLELAE